MFTIGAFAIIFDEQGRVLLGHRRDRDLWNLPGGAVEPGELPTETVVRETLEETGLEAVVARFVGFYAKEYNNDVVFTFLCRVTGGTLLAETSETDDCRYFPLDGIPENTVANHVWRILDAADGPEQPLFTMQTPEGAAERMENLFDIISSLKD